jgi:hypothetical protein
MLNQILAQLTQTNSLLHPAMVATMNKITAQYQPLEYSFLVYWPDAHYPQGKALAHEITHLLNGVTCFNGAQGLWKNPNNEIVADDILFIEAFATAEDMSKHLETLLNRVRYWGGVCAQEMMAVKIGTMMGSRLLLMPT